MEAQINKLASTYLSNVRPTGDKNLRAQCPLCDSSRAFIISTRHGGWLCWSCGEKGSLVGLLKHVGLSRKQIDRAVGVLRIPPPISAKAQRRKQLREGWSVLPEYILAAYDHPPTDLLGSGFDEALLKRHDVGLDEKNNRITFALRDMLGRLVGISGRAREDWQIPRYKVYDASPPKPPPNPRKAGELYGVVEGYVPDNRKHLYGFHDVYPERFHRVEEQQPPLVISEGYKSTLWLRQLGFHHAVGLQGSSMTQQQRRHLGKLRGPYYIMLDNEPGKGFPDRKGRCAAVEIARHLRKSGQVYICLYPEEMPIGTAPDDVTEPEVLTTMVLEAKTLGQLTTRRR